MELTVFLESWVFTWVLLPMLIFCARIMDVSIGTMRLIFISKGFKFYAPLLGFFEVIIWLVAIGQIIQHLSNFMCYIAYGLGFATGNYIGILLEERISLGAVVMRVIPKTETTALINLLREANFGVSSVDIEGMTGKSKMLLAILKRKDLTEVLGIIDEHSPGAFYTIEDVRTVKEGYFPGGKKRSAFFPLPLLQDFRIGK
jgi:uncharacterized protein YebE (UPF0316 family)